MSHVNARPTNNLELFESIAGRKRDDFRNRLIWGDNKLVMASLLKEFKGKIDLVYIDPPFDVGADYDERPDWRRKETVGRTSPRSKWSPTATWGKGNDSYLHMMSERFALMRELVHPEGAFMSTVMLRCCITLKRWLMTSLAVNISCAKSFEADAKRQKGEGKQVAIG